MRIWAKAAISGAALTVSAAGLLVAEVLVARSGGTVAVNPAPPMGVAAGPPGTAGATVVWLGDSTAAGVGVTTEADTLPEQTAALLGRPIKLTVLAHSGDRIADVLANQLPQLSGMAPSAVFISIGANDATHLTARSAFRRDYGALLHALPSSVRRVVMLGVPDMGAPTRLAQPLRAVAGWRGQALNGDVRNLARRTPDAIYVDIAAMTGPSFRREPARYFAPDHYHPDPSGYALWARAIATVLRHVPGGAYGA